MFSKREENVPYVLLLHTPERCVERTNRTRRIQQTLRTSNFEIPLLSRFVLRRASVITRKTVLITRQSPALFLIRTFLITRSPCTFETKVVLCTRSVVYVGYSRSPMRATLLGALRRGPSRRKRIATVQNIGAGITGRVGGDYRRKFGPSKTDEIRQIHKTLFELNPDVLFRNSSSGHQHIRLLGKTCSPTTTEQKPYPITRAD